MRPSAPRTGRWSSAGSRRARPPYLVDVVAGRDRVVYFCLVALWLLTNLAFWSWWLEPQHVVTLPTLVLNSCLVAYDILVPAWFLFFLGKMKEPNPAIGPPRGLRVAMVTTKVPGSEPWPVVEQTLCAMLDQQGYPHDVWLLDEGGEPEVQRRCEALGVRYFSRTGMPRYQLNDWPFKSRTKAGNYNSWLDAVAYEAYDVIVQMDTDHVPQPGYLYEMLRPFADPEVAYVAAPNICDKNTHDSWAVLARSEQESVFNGPIQAGYAAFGCPMIIGSHAAFRTRALRAIGGFQRTLAEDHDNARKFAADGYRGAFALRAIARGDGAPSFADAMVQEYQWARALVQILLNLFPPEALRMRPAAFVIFLFGEVWYPLLAGVHLFGHLLPFLALLAGINWVSVYYPEFLIRHSLVILSVMLTVWWVKERGWTRPYGSSFLTWRTVLMQYARWPWVLGACAEALAGWVARKDFNFRVTPKGTSGPKPLPLRFLAPYLAVLVAALALAAGWSGPRQVGGYMYFVLLFAVIYATLIAVVVRLHLRESAEPLLSGRRFRPQLGTVGGAICAAAIALAIRGPQTATAITWVGIDQPGAALADTSRILPDSVGGPMAAARPDRAAEQSAWRTRPTADALEGDRIALGVYDPHGDLGSDPRITLEHRFVQVPPAGAASFDRAVTEIQDRGRLPVITLETWPFVWLPGYSEMDLLRDVARGRYDRALGEVADQATANGGVIYLRWGHEMELCGLYPWSTCDPQAYVDAYRHVVGVFRAAGASNVRFVWSPAGEKQAVAYWPGRAYVDYIGITVLIADEWATWDRTRPQPFASAMHDYAALFDWFEKPILIAEFGVAMNDPDRKTAYLAEVADSIRSFPQVRGLIYFNDLQPERSHGITQPDWRLNRDDRRELLRVAAPHRHLSPARSQKSIRDAERDTEPWAGAPVAPTEASPAAAGGP